MFPSHPVRLPAVMGRVLLVLALWACSCACMGAEEKPAAAAVREAVGPAAGDRVLFTFAIFGDNKGDPGGRMKKAFALIKQVKPSFLLGMGDHFKFPSGEMSLAAFDTAVQASYGETASFYKRLWLTLGDNEAQAYSGKQSNAGSEKPFSGTRACLGRTTNLREPSSSNSIPRGTITTRVSKSWARRSIC